MTFGCGDNSCMFSVLNPPGGVGTNGGCQCFKNLVCYIPELGRWNREEVRQVEIATLALAQKLHKYMDMVKALSSNG